MVQVLIHLCPYMYIHTWGPAGRAGWACLSLRAGLSACCAGGRGWTAADTPQSPGAGALYTPAEYTHTIVRGPGLLIDCELVYIEDYLKGQCHEKSMAFYHMRCCLVLRRRSVFLPALFFASSGSNQQFLKQICWNKGGVFSFSSSQNRSATCFYIFAIQRATLRFLKMAP